jgi:hypothetical protein
MEDNKIFVMHEEYFQIEPEKAKGFIWTSDINQELPIKVKPYGLGSETPTTVS